MVALRAALAKLVEPGAKPPKWVFLRTRLLKGEKREGGLREIEEELLLLRRYFFASPPVRLFTALQKAWGGGGEGVESGGGGETDSFLVHGRMEVDQLAPP